MAGAINHRFVSEVEDAGSETEVGPDEWNDSLAVSGGSDGMAMVRRTAEDDGWRLEKRGAGLADINVTNAGNVGAGETTLHTHTIDASHLEVNKKHLVLEGAGLFANTAVAKTLEFKFGTETDVVLNAVTGSPQNVRWRYRIEVFRTASDAQRVHILAWVDGVQELDSLQDYDQDDGASIPCLIKGTATNNDDIVQNYSKTTYQN